MSHVPSADRLGPLARSSPELQRRRTAVGYRSFEGLGAAAGLDGRRGRSGSRPPSASVVPDAIVPRRCDGCTDARGHGRAVVGEREGHRPGGHVARTLNDRLGRSSTVSVGVRQLDLLTSMDGRLLDAVGPRPRSGLDRFRRVILAGHQVRHTTPYRRWDRPVWQLYGD